MLIQCNNEIELLIRRDNETMPSVEQRCNGYLDEAEFERMCGQPTDGADVGGNIWFALPTSSVLFTPSLTVLDSRRPAWRAFVDVCRCTYVLIALQLF